MAKQVIVMRADLGMNKGKLVAQGAHASLSAVLQMMTKFYSGEDRIEYELGLEVQKGTPLWDWLEGIFTKVCLRVDSEEELLNLYEKAKEAGLPCSLITDKGLTCFHGVPTKTCIAIGPADDDAINAVTGGLRLL